MPGRNKTSIERLEGNRVYFSEVDMLDGTPLRDIKPYVAYFDYRERMRCGWYDKHFDGGKTPRKSYFEIGPGKNHHT